MAGSKIHSMQVTAADNVEDLKSFSRDAIARESDIGLAPSRLGHVVASSNCGYKNRPGNLDEGEAGVPGLRTHAPWPGLHEACQGCDAPSVSRLGSGPQACEYCNHKNLGVLERGKNRECVGKNAPTKAGKYVPVTSSREIKLSNTHVSALRRTGAVMLATSSLLLMLLLIAWQGIDFSLFAALSPWLGIYLPIPLGILNGVWSLHCASRGFVRHQGTGSCAARAGLCGTAWGCSGPSCALNFGLDLGLLITALLATLPAGASARGCGYQCFMVLCFPCARVGGEGMAVCMVLAALGLVFGVGRKMWIMATALRNGTSGIDLLPW